MTTAIASRQNVFKKDADGTWYSVPAAEVDSFVQATEAIMLADFMSAEWTEANDDFRDRFGSYQKDL